MKDRNEKSVYGIGFLGTKYNTSHPLYNRWTNMISRCYNKKSNDYKYYGEKGVLVDDKWHNFSNYVEDIMKKENYSELLQNPLEWHIDKDLLGKNNKIYSDATCCIIKKNQNIKIQATQIKQTQICQYDLQDNLIREYDGVRIASRETGVAQSSISNCINNKIKTAGGYIWRRK